jgi:F-type H+-transporting ATPase subunit gamma
MRLAEIQLHIASMEELRRIMSALRSLASMRMQQAARTMASARWYSAAIATAIGDMLPLLPERPAAHGTRRGRRALILCTSEQGFVGDFNERLLDTARAELRPQDALFILGTRGGTLAEGRGWHPWWSGPMATRIASLTETVQGVMTNLYGAIARHEVASAAVIFARYHKGAPSSIERHTLFPLDLARSPPARALQPPLHNLSPDALLEKLVAEYVSALLSEAVIESLTSENAARFNAMEAARENVSHKLEDLEREGRQARQEEVTTELLDLVTGAEAAGSLRSGSITSSPAAVFEMGT